MDGARRRYGCASLHRQQRRIAGGAQPTGGTSLGRTSRLMLTGDAIRSAVSGGTITIDPFDLGLLNPNSYNYRLGHELKLAPAGILDPHDVHTWPVVAIPSAGYLLEPGRLYLGHTLERIGSSELVTSLIGRSSLGRLGLFLQLSADLGHQGAVHNWTLELAVAQPLRIYAGMPIGQVSFWATFGTSSLYQGRYGDTSGPREPVADGASAPRGE